MRLLLSLLVILHITSFSIAWRNFMRGRNRNGNLGEPVLSSKNYNLPKEQWFSQLLDHFNPIDIRVWKQRYFVNSDYYKPNGPIFLMIGAEGEVNPKWLIEGMWIDYAKELGAMCFHLEHRFYGKSHPTVDLSVKNLVYLNSEQALADLAYFIQAVNIGYKFPNDTKWIVFGGSYGGSLAAWMRAKYPHLVYGAVSASGPLLALIDFQEYYVVVEDALKQHSQQCVDAVADANMQFHIMLHHRNSQKQLTEKFRLCDPIDPGHTKTTDIANLYDSLASNIANIVQYNKDNRQDSGTVNITIDTICDILVDNKLEKPIDRLAYVNSMVLNATKEKCLDYRYSNMIHLLRNISWTSEQMDGGRQWVYQTCTEFGFFQTSTARPKLFSEMFPVDFYIQQCIDIFGPRYNLDLLKSSIARTNILYGALNLQVTNVVFAHGSVDPWHVLGITQSSNSQAPAIYIPGTAHCAVLYPSTEKDLPQLKQARILIKDLIKQWLKN
ncbi:putative serine protease K12H4.7 [Odontomachus brunneus]|uniref:putative serine protease K12H4.7 n=1 Tax=Odontomachus brunneus TaxID=486640 RepID=UPI0013F26080|nr:putative serine protease K12H4.7 [Odontomachus brunneus]XP_032679652.1 putative serine protease K12H4.7 [Odontomachus brunneus]XP_032679653.1 putative serine protease K12H4.7 [Odontomachus brunneus]